MNILFICSGNTCRSPMAEFICREELKKRNAENVNVASLGITANAGDPPTENAVIAMKEIGIDISSHRAKGADRAVLNAADRIFVLSEGHVFMLMIIAPEIIGKVEVLGGGIDDPYGGDLETYRKCRDKIYAAVKVIADEIADTKI